MSTSTGESSSRREASGKAASQSCGPDTYTLKGDHLPLAMISEVLQLPMWGVRWCTTGEAVP